MNRKVVWIFLLLSVPLFVSMYWANPHLKNSGESETAGDTSIEIKLEQEKVPRTFECLREIDTPLPEPKPGDWLYHNAEPGQSQTAYRNEAIRPTISRQTIYLKPLGSFSKAENRLMEDVKEFLGIFFQLPTVLLQTLPDEAVPNEYRRFHDDREQWQTSWILDQLKLELPDNALALIALTSTDLYPDESWNFVFGQASLIDRVGVWSFARFGDPSKNYDLCLLRTNKTASHEMGHILSMEHCISYRCNLNGANSLEEMDKQPLRLCSLCLNKLCWNLNFDPIDRFIQLESYSRERNIISENHFWKTARHIMMECD